MKKCYLCNIEKNCEAFYSDTSRVDGLSNRCKDCDSSARKERIRKNPEQKANTDRLYAGRNKDKITAYQSEYRGKNAAEISIQRAGYRKANKEIISARNKEWREKNHTTWCLSQKQYYESNKTKVVRRNSQYKTSRRKTNHLVHLACLISRRLHHALSRNTYTKKSRTCEILGCAYADLVNHLESQFKDGMSWENRGKWHIDHKIPLASAKTEEELLKLCHYTNLQPLWAFDNLSKGSKILPEYITGVSHLPSDL